jgi:uncharacterized membrane protein YbaN (DUF454 family)
MHEHQEPGRDTVITETDVSAYRSLLGKGKRIGFIVLGCFFVLLGIIGAMLPVMPTTVFLIAAAWAFGRSSPRLENWMLQHPKFGPVLIAWRKEGAIPKHGKIAACSGITVGYIIFYVCSSPSWWLALIVFAFMFGTALWIVTRPAPSTQSSN